MFIRYTCINEPKKPASKDATPKTTPKAATSKPNPKAAASKPTPKAATGKGTFGKKSGSKSSASSGKSSESDVCIHFRKGNCKHGSRCRDRHVSAKSNK